MTNDKTKSCPFCGHNVTDDDMFCNSCGASLTDTVEVVGKIPVVVEQTTNAMLSQHRHSVVVDYKPEPKNVVAIISMVFGILAVGFSVAPFMWCLSFLFSPIAFILGLIGVFKQKRRYFAVAGIALALIAVLLYLLQFFGVFYVY